MHIKLILNRQTPNIANIQGIFILMERKSHILLLYLLNINTNYLIDLC